MSPPARKSCPVLRDGGTRGRGRVSPQLCEVSNAPQRGRGESTRPRDEPRGACASVSSGGNKKNPTYLQRGYCWGIKLISDCKTR